mmetsp:Transcript_1998/g.4688  ORF Transcript_1998/g.4688 Transcript_1998/m.4688 type:complete len:336 (+) Transcript_1998:570-1577(+)
MCIRRSLPARSSSSSQRVTSTAITLRRVARDRHSRTASRRVSLSMSCARHETTSSFIPGVHSSSTHSSASSPPACSKTSSLSGFPATTFHTASTVVTHMGSARVLSSTVQSRLSISVWIPLRSPTTAWLEGFSSQRRESTDIASCRTGNGCSPRSLISESIMATALPPSSSWYPGSFEETRTSLRQPRRMLSSDCSVKHSTITWRPSSSRKRSGQCGTTEDSTARHCTCSWRCCWRVYLLRAGCAARRWSRWRTSAGMKLLCCAIVCMHAGSVATSDAMWTRTLFISTSSAADVSTNAFTFGGGTSLSSAEATVSITSRSPEAARWGCASLVLAT